jgi:hypothetical protein
LEGWLAERQKRWNASDREWANRSFFLEWVSQIVVLFPEWPTLVRGICPAEG